MRTVVYARVRDLHAVDEIMQEVALAVVRNSAPLRELEKLAPWLYQLAVRQSLLYRRKCGRQKKLNSRYAERLQATPKESPGGDPLNWLLADERKLMVRQALERLSRRDCEILLLKYTENWSYHQIADHLGISHSAVETRLHRARKRLRNELTAMETHEAITK